MENILVSKKISTSSMKIDTSIAYRWNVNPACHSVCMVRGAVSPVEVAALTVFIAAALLEEESG